MPRKVLPKCHQTAFGRDLVDDLSRELTKTRPVGQPLIYEEVLGNGNLLSTVVWDRWVKQSLEERTTIILDAYNKALPDTRKKLVLATGLTLLEAHSAGLLPFQLLPIVRDTDPVTLKDCFDAMSEVKASTLAVDKPQLRFATNEEAVEIRDELLKRLPKSAPVWVILEDYL